MKNFLLNIKFLRKCKTFPTSNGMTYIELIVVLGIWAVMSSIVMFDYQEFQAKVDIKSLASDIALKIVEAQKSALSGKWASGAPLDWKPSYGVYFDINSIPPGDNKSFIYFADLYNDKIYNDAPLDTINMTKGNYIDKIETCAISCLLINPAYLSITFKRPDSGVFFYSNVPLDPKDPINNFDYIKITIKSPKGAAALIKIYPSGRIQVN